MKKIILIVGGIILVALLSRLVWAFYQVKADEARVANTETPQAVIPQQSEVQFPTINTAVIEVVPTPITKTIENVVPVAATQPTVSTVTIPTQIVLSSPALISPKNNSSDIPADRWLVLSWKSVTGAVQYQVSIQDVSSGEKWLSSVPDLTLRTDSVGGAYSWKVRACNSEIISDSTCGSWSEVWKYSSPI